MGFISGQRLELIPIVLYLCFVKTERIMKKTRLVTIKEYIDECTDKKKSQVYNDVKSGKIPTEIKYGYRFIRVKI